MNKIKVPALRYHGGKFKISKWIHTYLPQHTTYVEPFGGGASILLTKTPSPIEVYNDLDQAIVNFFQVLRVAPDKLIQEIELTPFSRDEFIQSATLTGDLIEDARRVYVRSWQSHVPILSRLGGWRNLTTKFDGNSTVQNWNRIDHLWAIAARLKEVQIENRPAIEVIKDYDNPNTLFFVDPPYVNSSRRQAGKGVKDGYRHEMTDEQHCELSEVLHSCKSKVILCGYQSALYDGLYRDWIRETKTTTTSRATQATECLWLSPSIKSAAGDLFPELDWRR